MYGLHCSIALLATPRGPDVYSARLDGWRHVRCARVPAVLHESAEDYYRAAEQHTMNHVFPALLPDCAAL